MGNLHKDKVTISVVETAQDQDCITIIFDKCVCNIQLEIFTKPDDSKFSNSVMLESEVLKFSFSQPRNKILFQIDRTPSFIAIRNGKLKNGERIEACGIPLDRPGTQSTTPINHDIDEQSGIRMDLFQKGLTSLLTSQFNDPTNKVQTTLDKKLNKLELKNENIYAELKRKEDK